MKLHFAKHFSLTVIYFLVAIPPGYAQQPRLIDANTTLHGSKFFFLGQQAEESSIVLDANNGFFDGGVFRAGGKHAAPPEEAELISSHFTHLLAPSKQTTGTARWHLWITQPGEIRLEVLMKVPNSEAGTKWKLQIGKKKHVMESRASDATSPQRWQLGFNVGAAGKHTLELSKAEAKATPGTEVRKMYLTGPAMTGASILRARWRPAAIHTQYFSSSCPETTMWVFESQNLSTVSSYSPMTTRFGYFGATFDADGKAAGGVNFSMWAANSKAKTAPPLESMPHLLATGNPKADFGGFGHEGSGVKIRNWEPYRHHPRSVIQALRVETSEGMDTYSGYLFDERINRWVLYAIGRRPQKQRDGGLDTPTVLRPASFCEVPGPPSVQRSGDQVRIMRRRGWFYGKHRQWHVVDLQTMPNKGVQPINRLIGAKDGWLVMGTGGMEMLAGPREVRLQKQPTELPVYLQPEIATQLFERPVEFGSSFASSLTKRSAIVEYELSKAGTNPKAILYYGVRDCLTFVKRKLHGTEKKGVSGEMLSSDRTWSSSTEATPVHAGKSQFALDGLKADTAYFYRLFVANDEGKSWDFKSGSFHTK